MSQFFDMKTRYVFLIITVIFIWIFLMFNMCSSEEYGASVDNTGSTYTKQYRDAALNAQILVKRTLKAPSTAKFPPTSTANVESTSNGTYIVSSYVDSQNGYGAMVRQSWVAEIEYLPNNQIKLVNINFF